MSYCQWCPGSYSNIMYTFGGDYDGSGDENNLANWSVNPNLLTNNDPAHFSVNPEREAQKMYLHISSKAPTGCVDLTSTNKLSSFVLSPNSQPTVGAAEFDSMLNVPKCSKVTSFCDSKSLLLSRDSIGGVSEPNGSNSLDSCKDGASGYFHSDESVDSIKVLSVGGGLLQSGGNAKIIAKIWAYSSSDYIDFFYANTATDPTWIFIKTLKASSQGMNTVNAQYTLGNGKLQAVRVIIRYNGVASSCPKGSYDDVDDLVFNVKPSSTTTENVSSPIYESTPQPSRPPTRKPSRKPSRKPTGFPIYISKKTPKPSPFPVSSPKSGK